MFLKLKAALKALRGHSDLNYLRVTGLNHGERFYVGADVLIDSGHRHLITIGDDVTISDRVHILAHDASTKQALGFTRIAPVTIGNRVFVGAGVIILPGVTIGDDVIIGAGSIVTRNIPAGTVAHGAPATVQGDTATFVQRRQAEMDASPSWDSPEWIAGRGLTPERANQMRESLTDSPTGFGYLV